MPKKILQKDAPGLREVAKSVALSDIQSAKIRKVIAEMRAALASQDDGVAIAAPQIGYPLRIFVVSEKVEEIIKREKTKPRIAAEQSNKEHKAAATTAKATTVYINPVITKLSKEKKPVEEGCLSVRYLYGKVSRAHKAVVEALDENGKKFTKGASGLLAQIFQHETDHLNGILFIDKAKYLEEIKPEQTHAKS